MRLNYERLGHPRLAFAGLLTDECNPHRASKGCRLSRSHSEGLFHGCFEQLSRSTLLSWNLSSDEGSAVALMANSLVFAKQTHFRGAFVAFLETSTSVATGGET